MLKAFRGFLVVCCFGIFGIGAVLLRYLVLIFPIIFIKDKEQKLKICSKILQKSWKIFVMLLEALKIIKVDKLQAESIKNIKNSIIVSTHPCFLDVVVLISIIPNTTCFVAEKLSRNPFLKGMVNLLFILESKNIEEWEKSAENMLDCGFNVIIFPMGARHAKYEKPKIRKGAALLAQKTKKNIAILKLETDYEFLMKNQPIYEIQETPAKYNILFLKELNINQLSTKYNDEVTFRKEVTKLIENELYC